MPSDDLRVSQHHRVLAQGTIARRMFDRDAVLVPAKALLALPGVVLEIPANGVTYFHVMLDRHEVVLANGLQAESLYLGPQTLEAIGPKALEEICEILDLSPAQLGVADTAMAPARLLINGKCADRLISRHLKNHRPLSEPLDA